MADVLPFFQGAAFDDDATQMMGKAFDRACQSLHEEKAQEARRWLRSQEHHPYYIGAVIGAGATVVGAILGALIASYVRGAR
jgi:hypothetical protein